MPESGAGQIDAIDLKELVRFLVKRSGKSASRISTEIGRGHGFVGSLMHQRSIPTAALLADIAQQCGYALILSGPEECITVFPRTAWDDPGAWGEAAAEIDAAGKHHVCAVGKVGDLGELDTYPEIFHVPGELEGFAWSLVPKAIDNVPDPADNRPDPADSGA